VGQSSRGSSLQWDRAAEGQAYSGTERQRDKPTEGQSSRAASLQWDREAEGEAYSGTAQQRVKPTVGQSSRGTSLQWERAAKGQAYSGKEQPRDKLTSGQNIRGTRALVRNPAHSYIWLQTGKNNVSAAEVYPQEVPVTDFHEVNEEANSSLEGQPA